MRFALVEAKLCITKAIRLFEFQKSEKTEVNQTIAPNELLLVIDFIFRFQFNWEILEFLIQKIRFYYALVVDHNILRVYFSIKTSLHCKQNLFRHCIFSNL